MQPNRGIAVVAAGTGINLALGVLYSWSIFKEAISQSVKNGGDGGFHWDMASINDPYALACLVFAFCMIPAGRMQDRLGPRLAAFSGGLLVSLGFLLISQSQNYWVWLLGFGGLVGAGIAFGYSAATPAALKWFSPTRSGLIAGIVVSGFGLAPAYIAPLGNWLMQTQGLLDTMQIFGLAFLVMVSLLSLLLVPPPSDHRVEIGPDPRKVVARMPKQGLGPRQVLRQWQFWVLWSLYFIGAGAGLMVIGSISGMAKASMGELAFIAVAIMAIGNASGRILLGQMADRFGRCRVLAGVFLFQSLLMFAAANASPDSGALVVVLVATLIGFNYGANLAIFPSFTKVFWGMSHFGVNYGMLFTAWGVGGFVMVKLSSLLKSASGNFTSSFLVAGGLLLGGTLLALFLDRQRRKGLLQVEMAGA